MEKRQSSSLLHALHWGALEIAGIYLIIGALWILFSEQIAARVASNEEILATISLYKGWAFVLLTALLLYKLIQRHILRLHASEMQWKRVLDALPALISYIDKNQHYRFTNSAYQDWFEGETVGKHIQEVVGAPAYQSALKYIDKVLSGETVRYETEVLLPDGARFISAIYVPDIGVNGQVEGFFTLVHDVTEQKQVSDERRLWGDAFEGCAHGIVIGDPNSNRVVVCNPAFAKMHRCSVEDIVGTAILSLYAPAEHEHVRRQIQKADQIGYARFETGMIRRGGFIFPVEVDVVSVLGEDGEVLHRVVTAQDVSERKQAQEKLRESEAKYRILVENLPAITYISGPEQYLGVNYVSPQIESLGFDLDTWLADPEFWLKQIHPEDRERVKSELQRFQNGAESFRVEYRLILPTGETRWFRDESIRVKDQEGKTLLKQGFMLDITESKLAAEVLQESEERYRIVSELTSDYAYKDRVEEDGSIVPEWITESFTRITGYTLEEAKAPGFWQQWVLPEDIPVLLEHVRVTLSGQPDTREMRVTGKTGQIIYLRDYANPIWDPKKKRVVGLYGAVQDITEFKQAEEKLRLQSRWLEQINDAVITSNQDLFITAWNPAAERIYGWKADEVIGKKGEEVLRTEFFSKARAEVLRELKESGEFSSEITQLRKDGSRIHVETRTVTLRDERGRAVGYVSVNRDITERKQAEEYLRRFELLSQHSRDIILFMEYQNGRILEANAAAMQEYGYSRDELLSLTVQDLRAPHTLNLTADQMAKADAGGILFETIHRRKDGSTFPVEVSSQGAILGGVRALISIVRDITERKRAEDALQASQEQLLSLIKQAPISIAMFDREMHYIVTSQRWVAEYGRGHSDLTGRSHYEIHPDVPEQWKNAHGRGLAGESIKNNNDTWTQADGSRYWLRWAIVPWHDSQGEIGGIIISAEDITESKRAEEALRLKDELLRLTSEMAKVGGWEFNPQTGKGTWTDEVARIHDLDPAQATNVEIGLSFYVDESRRKIEQAVQEAVEFAKPYDLELEMITAKGNRKWVRTVALPVVQDDRVVKVQGIFQDITERKNAEKALTESEARFRSLFEESADANLLLENGIFTDCNLATVQLMRAADKDEILLVSPARLSPEYQPDGRPSSEKAEELIRLTLEKGSNRFEWIHRRMDGTDFPVEVLLTSISTGDRQVIHAVWRDITERKQIEQELQTAHDELENKVQERTAALSEANALLQALMDHMPDHIYFKDTQSRFIRNSRSQASLLGLNDPAEAVGKTDFDFFPHAARSFAEEQELMRSGKALVDLEEWVVWPDGHETWVSTTKLPLRNSEGETIGIFGISHDITERKRTEQAIRQLNADLEKQTEQLQAANKELEAFSYSVSHDLRAPLRAIDGYTRILVEDYESILDDEGKRICSVIGREARRMGQLIDDLLSFSRLGRKEMYSSKIEMRTSVVSILNELLKEEERERFDIHIANLPAANGDSSLIRQVWVNLLANAIKFTSNKERAVIEVGSKTTKEEFIYYVRDNGAGFEMEYSNKLFGVFQRLHSESQFSGTGVGLAIVQRIIRRHDGRVWAEGEVEKGATFYFALPRKEKLS